MCITVAYIVLYCLFSPPVVSSSFPFSVCCREATTLYPWFNYNFYRKNEGVLARKYFPCERGIMHDACAAEEVKN